MFHRAPARSARRRSRRASTRAPARRAGSAGRQSTTKNLTVVRVDVENNLLYLSGPVPGARNALVKIVRSSFAKKARG
jgi:large subunit ribosomal protein L3